MTLAISMSARAQDVVINSYSNESDVRDEFTELLVIEDSTDMRGWSLRDNMQNTNSWQTQVSLTNNTLWNNLRKGTVIVIFHRPCNSSSTAYTIDTNKNDGYIQVYATHSSFFSGGSFPTTPCATANGGNTLNIDNNGDIIQLRDASNTHVHALGHDNSPGSSWTTDIAGSNRRALLHNATVSTGRKVVVCPGNVISDFRGSCSSQCYQVGNSKTAVVTSKTYGLPNTCSSSSGSNSDYWRTVRRAEWTSPTLTLSAPGPYNHIVLSWNKCTDPIPADSTVGYLILFNTSNTFDTPDDGTRYVVGDAVGSAKVVGVIKGSGTTTFSDFRTLNCLVTYYYRVYVSKFTDDNLNGNSFDMARGIAYNDFTFAEANIKPTKPASTLIRHY